ncbi:exported hypothetical protein [Parafrankia sp. Ea1.12]|nr:exported hypothetical protein [Parafrankia sp. Ea1.12]
MSPFFLCLVPAASSMPWSAIFKSNGEITPPCGAPFLVGVYRPLSTTPAFSQARTCSRAGKPSSFSSRWLWSSRSNAASRSASRTQPRVFLPRATFQIISIASWQPRPGRKPYCLASSRASHSGSNALRTRCCWARSAMTGIPIGRCFPPLFGMYTRRTGSARPSVVWRCRKIASSARLREVRTTRPSTPPARRPVLRWLTCRTLTSVLARLRSMSFCRLRVCFQSPACAALKILCRSRRTLFSSVRQSMASQSSGSSDPFTMAWDTPTAAISTVVPVISSSMAPNMLLGFWRFMGIDSFKGLPGSRQLPFGTQAPSLVCGQLYGYGRVEVQPPAPAFLLSFRHAAVRFSSHPVSPRDSAPLTVGLPGTGQRPRTVARFPRSARVRCDRCRVSSLPRSRGARTAKHIPPAATAVSQRQALTAVSASHHRRSFLTRLPSRLHLIHPSGLPLACSLWMDHRPLGFPPGFTPRAWSAYATHAGGGDGL